MIYGIVGGIIYLLMDRFIEKRYDKSLDNWVDWSFGPVDLRDYVDAEILRFILIMLFIIAWPFILFIFVVLVIMDYIQKLFS